MSECLISDVARVLLPPPIPTGIRWIALNYMDGVNNTVRTRLR